MASKGGLQFSYLSFFVFTLLLAPLNGYSANDQDGESSLFSLFNLKEKSRFWTESVIHSDFVDLRSSNPENRGPLNYSTAGNIANYLNLQEVDSIYLPVPVNFIFIGFQGKGNEDFRLHAEELERWFTKIDHIFPHTRAPQIEEVLNPFYKINVDKGNHHFPVLSHVNYNFSVHGVQMNEKLTSVFERAIAVLSRKNDVSGDSDDEMWQVDLDMMEVLFDSFVEYLQIGNAYNIFILNPKLNANKTRYGYRRGLSDSEIDMLKQNRTLRARVRKSGNNRGSTFGPSNSLLGYFLAIEEIKGPPYKKRPMAQFAWTSIEETDMVELSTKCSEAINSVEKLYEGKDTGFFILSKVLQLLNGKSKDLKLSLEKLLKFGQQSSVRADCLTDTWIGKNRWAFTDLSAGPFAWGPAVGGQGVRTKQSLPNVTKTIGAVAEITDEEAENDLQDAIQERFGLLGNREHQVIDILLAEIDIYELFASRHCKGRRTKLALCEELNVRMRELKTELQSLEVDEFDESHRRKAFDALKRIESNLFRETYRYEDLPEFQNYTVARDTFLAHLGSILWGSMRHIIAPSTADGAFHYYEQISYQLYFITLDKVENVEHLPVDLKALKDGLSSILLSSQKVEFSQHMLALSNDPALAMAFSVARRTAAVPILFVNGSYIKTVSNYIDSSIIQHQLRRLDDHNTLKGNHANNRISLEVPIFWFIHPDPLLVDKHYQAKALSDMIIVVQSDASWESHLQCNGRPLVLNLRIPIKAAVAAAAEHVAGLLPHHLVYSQAHETAIEDWTWSVGCSPFSMTSQGWRVSQVHSDAIARNYIITGLEESIQTVNSAIHRLSLEKTTLLTINGSAYELRDLIGTLRTNGSSRSNMGLLGPASKCGGRIQYSWNAASGISRVVIAAYELAQKSYNAFQSMERKLVNHYNLVVALWRRIAHLTGELRYDDALKLLYNLQDASTGFAEQVNLTRALLHPIQCTRERNVEVVVDMTTVPAFFLIFLIIWLLLKPRQPKPKIN